MPKIPKPVSKTIGIVGSRRRSWEQDYQKCLNKFNEIYKPGDKLVSGGCAVGGDFFAYRIASMMGLSITIHFADWNGSDGKRAGFVRNTRIATDCDILIALVAEDRLGGTEDTVKKALALGKEVILL